jgi:hypothetical protein
VSLFIAAGKGSNIDRNAGGNDALEMLETALKIIEDLPFCLSLAMLSLRKPILDPFLLLA